MTLPSDLDISAWARLLRASRGLVDGVEADLKATGLPPLSWYDALLELDRAGDAGLRPTALQDAMLLAQYNLSRLLDRMEAAGLVARRPCPADGRGQVVAVTAEGQAMRRRMWPVYRDAIASRFSSRLREGEAEVLARILGRITQAA